VSGKVVFLTIDTVLTIHQRMIAEFGGDAGIRDHGLLEAAVAMPRQQFGGAFLHSNLAEQAAAYLYHICCNHPFLDGNKRTALATADFFILLNNAELVADNDELVEITVGVAEGQVKKAALTAFFKSHLVD
jgi:death-on-curing protein